MSSETPGAARRRRLFFLLVLAGVVAGASIAPRLGWNILILDASPTRRMAQAVERLHARTALPDHAVEELARLVSEAEAITAREHGMQWWWRDAAALEAAWSRVERFCAEQVTAHRRQRSEALAYWHDLAPRAAEALQTAKATRDLPGFGAQQAAILQRSMTDFDLARRQANGGRLEQSIASLERSLAGAESLVAHRSELEARFSDPYLLSVWRSWAEATLAESRRSGDTAVLVDKVKRRLDVYQAGALRASFSVELGRNGLSRKLRSGDRATPEGRYRIVDLRTGARTEYYKAALLDYPNKEDLERLEQEVDAGRAPRGSKPGSLIEIHGAGGAGKDWTDGCIALRDEEMDRLFSFVRVGSAVTIVGTLGDE